MATLESSFSLSVEVNIDNTCFLDDRLNSGSSRCWRQVVVTSREFFIHRGKGWGESYYR
jgi:hypothetical protein